MSATKKSPPSNVDQNILLLFDALHYMNMAELKRCCQSLGISDKGKKGFLIDNIMQFIKTGTAKQAPVMPKSSQAKNYPAQPLQPDSLMLYGSYKNDAKTRAFFKSLIGAHFHFTAFGIDWLEDRWLQGNPPTYQEFADYWIAEMQRRENKKTAPKKEWAYINFLQQHADVPKEVALQKWKKFRAEKAALAFKIIKNNMPHE